MSTGNSKTLWYAAGLHFECLGCGRCCSGPGEGYIWVSRPEIRLIARYLDMPVKELKGRFLRRVGLRTTIIEEPTTHDCIFLRHADRGRRCSIYPVRPGQCRTWPFWRDNLATSDVWNEAGRKCPGINRGAVYTPEQIRAVRDNAKQWYVENE